MQRSYLRRYSDKSVPVRGLDGSADKNAVHLYDMRLQHILTVSIGALYEKRPGGAGLCEFAQKGAFQAQDAFNDFWARWGWRACLPHV
jgi:hypothetical protein